MTVRGVPATVVSRAAWSGRFIEVVAGIALALGFGPGLAAPSLADMVMM
jgi:hypothetical protein